MIGLGNSVVKRKLAGASVPAAPANIVQPSLSGSGAVGEAVICNRGTWSGSPTPTYTYDFRLDSVSVQNSSSNSYTPSLADDGKTLTCLVTATNSQGSASEGTSNSIVIGIAPSNTIAPTLSPSGTQSTGTVITVGNGTFAGTAPLTYAYRWKRNGSIILGETANTYTLVAGDDGTVITAEVKASNAYGESAYIGTSNQVDAVNAIAPVNTARPVVSGTYVVGQTLSSTTGTWTGIPTPTFSYQWYRGATLISGATNSTYTLVQADAGNTSNINCVVTATNSAGSASADSNTVAQIFDATWWDFRQTLSITDTTINNAMNTYTITRKSISATASLGAYPFVGGTATTHSRNLYNPADTDAAKRIAWAGTVTHNTNGVQGNGTNGTGNTYINQQSEITGDFAIIIYSRTNSATASVDLGGVTSSIQGIEMALRYSNNITYYSARTVETNMGTIVLDSSGCFIFKRVGNVVTLSRNGVNLFTGNNPNSFSFNGNISILSRNTNGTIGLYSARQYTHFEFIAGTIDAMQETNLANAVIAKETALGRNV